MISIIYFVFFQTSLLLNLIQILFLQNTPRMKSHPLPGMQGSIRVGPSGGTVTEPPNKPPPPLPKKQPSYVNITKVSILISININIQQNLTTANKLLSNSDLQQIKFHSPYLRIVLETYWIKQIAFKTNQNSSSLVLPLLYNCVEMDYLIFLQSS